MRAGENLKNNDHRVTMEIFIEERFGSKFDERSLLFFYYFLLLLSLLLFF